VKKNGGDRAHGGEQGREKERGSEAWERGGPSRGRSGEGRKRNQKNLDEDAQEASERSQGRGGKTGRCGKRLEGRTTER